MTLSTLLTKLDDELSAVAATVTAGIATLYLGYRKVMQIGKQDEHKTADSAAHVDVIEMLRDQIMQLSAQNTRLTEIVNKLQLEVIALRDENAQIVRRLHDR